MSPKISILILTHNSEDHLNECLDSISGQTLKDLEIIQVNNEDSLNRSLEKATGEYIVFVDSDDYLDQDALENLYRIAAKFHADIVKANYYQPGAKKTTLVEEITPDLSLRPFHALEHPEIFRYTPAIWSAIYRREFLLQNDINFLPTSGHSCQNLSFSFKAWVLAKVIVLMPDAFLHHRLTTCPDLNNPDELSCIVNEYVEIETFLCERGIFPDYGSILMASKFRDYRHHLQQLSPQLAKKFYQTFRNEFISAADEGLPLRTDLAQSDWHALQTLLKHPRLAYRLLRH